MNNRPYNDNSQNYKDAGHPVIPTNGKAAFINNFPSFSHNLPSQATMNKWRNQYPDANIALVTGAPQPDSTVTAAIDLDIDDQRVDFVCAVIGGSPPKRTGKKGMNIYCRVPVGTKTKKFKDSEGKEIGSLLTKGALSILPPSIHPETGKPYKWLSEKALWEVKPYELPLVTEDLLTYITKVLESPECAEFINGGPTHSASVSLAAKTAIYTTEEIHCRSIPRLFKQPYEGDTVKELPEHYRSALELRAKKRDAGQYDPGSEGLKPIGVTRDGKFAVIDQNLNMVRFLSAKQITNADDLLGFASMDHWAERFPAKNAYGFSPKIAGNTTMEACRKAGRISRGTLRGRGSWRNKSGDFVINLDGPIPAGDNNIYIRPDDEPFNAIEITPNELLDHLYKLPWKKPEYAVLLLGWLTVAPLCGALDKRPHLFVKGPMNSGKSTVVDIAKYLLAPLAFSCEGNTTEAGIRQAIGVCARPSIVDEAETENAYNLDKLIRLARAAYTASASRVRGTPEGHAIEFNITTMFLFAAINSPRLAPADRSRIMFLELREHDNSAEIKKDLKNFVRKLKRGCDWVLRSANQIGSIFECIDLFEAQMPQFSNRAAENLAILLGGAYYALNQHLPSDDEILQFIKPFVSIIDSHVEQHEQSDAIECLNYMMAFVTKDGSLGKLLNAARKPGRIKGKIYDDDATLMTYGIRPDLEEFYIRASHPLIYQIFRESRWRDGAHVDALMGLLGAKRTKKYFFGLQDRVIAVPDTVFQLDGSEALTKNLNLEMLI